MEPIFGIVLFVFGLNIAFKGNAMGYFAVISDMFISAETSNQVTSQAQTASRAYQDGGPREVRTSLRAFFARRKKIYLGEQNTFLCQTSSF